MVVTREHEYQFVLSVSKHVIQCRPPLNVSRRLAAIAKVYHVIWVKHQTRYHTFLLHVSYLS